MAAEVEYAGDVDFTAPWRRVTLQDAIREETGIDIRAQDELPGEGTWAKRVDDLLSKHVEPKLTNPTFVTDYPIELSPFAKDHRTEEGLVERFECFAGGMEFANAFTELNDPDEQRARFEQQRRHSAEGDDEAQPYDEDFVARARAGHAADGRHRRGHRPAGDAAVGRTRSARSCSFRRCAADACPGWYLPSPAGVGFGVSPPGIPRVRGLRRHRS